MAPEPFGNITGAESYVGFDSVIGNHVALNVAVYGFRADCQHACEFLGREQAIAMRELLENVSRLCEG